MDQNVFRLGLRVAIIIRNYSLKLLQHLKAGFSLLKNSTLHLLKSLEFMSKSFSGHGFFSAPSTAAVSVNQGRRAVPLAPAFQAAVVRSVEAAFFQPSTSCRCSFRSPQMLTKIGGSIDRRRRQEEKIKRHEERKSLKRASKPEPEVAKPGEPIEASIRSFKSRIMLSQVLLRHVLLLKG